MIESTPKLQTRMSVPMQWGVKIPLRDGVTLNATLYLPKDQETPVPTIFTLTPYIGQTYHDVGLHFAENGFPFLTVDVRGRGNSEGEFLPNFNEGKDGHDIVEWLAQQPYCNGQVAMWGGSYGGFDQWSTAREFPPHLAAIAPVAPPYIAVDFPIRKNISYPYLMQWLMLVAGRTSQDKLFWSNEFYWAEKFREFFEAGLPFKQLDSFLGNPSKIFQLWLSHPHQDEYWDSYNPTDEAYRKFSLPILTITGIYDGDQPGALMHYRLHMKNASPDERARHHLIIGPWDHAGTRVPQERFSGLTVGEASLVNLRQLHVEWYRWVMQDGPKPEFLKKMVAYYVMVAEKWRYADSLDAVTSHKMPFYLQSVENPTDVFAAGTLVSEPPVNAEPDSYVYDPRDVSMAELECSVDASAAADQRIVYASVGKQLVYHSKPFEKDTEISGFFECSLWLAIDQPDTDFTVTVYDIGIDGSSVMMTDDMMRARYRESLREENLVTTTEPLRYDFDQCTFVSRVIERGHRLRVVIGPINSIYVQKNYNSGKNVSDESVADARTVTVRLFHDEQHPSSLTVPYGQPDQEE